MQICYNPKALFVVFSERHTSLLQWWNPAQASWPAKGSLQTIPTPPQNSRTRFLYDLQIFHFSCQLPAHCYTKMFCGRFAILLIYTVHRQQPLVTAFCRVGTPARPPCPAPQAALPPHAKQIPSTGSPYFLGTPSHSTSCSPAFPNPANTNTQQTKPFSRINGYPAVLELTFAATRLQFVFVFMGWEMKGETTGRATHWL